MTAHAMAEERDKVVAAGMNDHVSKPIIPVVFFRTLYHWVKSGLPMSEVSSDKKRETTKVFMAIPGVNFQEGLERVAGNAETYLRLLKEFPSSQKVELETIKEAIYTKDRQKAITCIHTMKGLAGNLSITDLCQASVALEKSLIASNWEESNRLFQIFQTAFQHFAIAIDALKLPSANFSPPKTMLLVQALEVLEEVKVELRSNSPKAGQSLAKLAAGFVYPADCVVEFDDLAKTISQFEFEQALQILASIEEKLRNEVATI